MNNQINIADPKFKANPYPFYAKLRAESPVFQVRLPDKQYAWLVTRYDDVVTVLKDDQRFVKNPRNAMTQEQLKRLPWVPPMFKPLMSNLLDNDWETHARLRGLIHKAFTPSRVEKLQQRIGSLSNELIDGIKHRGQMDLIRDYALPIPLTIISEMLGVSKKDQDNFHRWTQGFVELSASRNMVAGIIAIVSITRLLRRLFRERRANPQDDLITALIQAKEGSDQLNDDELLAMVFVLLIAGHETTVNLIGSGMLALMENPDQMALLRKQPELLKNAVEELVRYVNPVEQATERYAREDMTLHDVTIRKGEMVLAVVASANRDEQYFTSPETLDITRENNKHLGFGLGVHYCVGAPLARMEAQIAIQTLVACLPTLHLKTASESLQWRAGLTVRGLKALPVVT
jgi:cytochrome P450